MEKSNANRINSGPRRSFTEDFFSDPFENINPQRGFQRRFVERGLFDDDDDSFFDGFSRGTERHNHFRHEPNLFHSLPRRQYKTSGKTEENGNVERPIPIQYQDYKFDNVHRIPIRQLSSSDNQKDQKLKTNNMPTEYEQNLPGKVRRFSPADKRSRFSNCQQQKNEQNHPNNSNQFKPVPDIVIDDYGDGRMTIEREHDKPAVIPLPAPAIPLPAPQQNKTENESDPSSEGAKPSEVNATENDKCTDKDKELIDTASDVYAITLDNNNEQLIQLIDDTERKVELLRENATSLEQEKESILNILKNIKLTGSLIKIDQGDRDELVLNIDRIITRCRSVDVCVNTPRDEHQKQALQHVNEVICAALNKVNDTLKTKAKIQGFLNACLPEESGHIDDKFQSLIIACTLDDQKRVRQRLVKIIAQLEQTQHPLQNSIGQ